MARKRNKIAKIRTQKYIEQNGLCYWCKEPFGKGPLSCTADHILEQALGGARKDSDNIVAAHQICNVRRSKHLALECNVQAVRKLSARMAFFVALSYHFTAR